MKRKNTPNGCFGMMKWALVASLARLNAPNHVRTPAKMLKALMRSHGLSRHQLCLVLGASNHAVRAWARGRRNPSGAALKLLWLVDALARNEAPRTFLDLALWRRSAPPGPKDWIKDQSGEH